MSKRERHDSDRRGDRRDSQPEDEQQRRTGETDAQEGDSLTALKAILAKVAALLRPLQLTPEESIRLVEQLYGKVLETDLQLAGEADDTRKSSVLAAIQNATIRREGDKVVVDYSTATADKADTPDKPETASPEAAAKDRAVARPAADRAAASRTTRNGAARNGRARQESPPSAPAEADPQEG